MSQILVLGSGLGGLSCGVQLARMGHQVTVLEQSPQAGGCLQSFYRHGHQWETGMHFVGSYEEGQVLHPLLQDYNLHLPLVPLDAGGYEQIHLEGQSFAYAKGEAFVDVLAQHFPQERDNLWKYLQLVRKIMHVSSIHHETNLAEQLHTMQEYQSRSVDSILESMIGDATLRQVLVGNLPLYAGRKGQTPFATHAFITEFYNASAARIAGGSQIIAEQLIQQLEQLGGKVLTRQRVTEIHCNHSQATGVTTAKGAHFPADCIVSTLHPQALLSLLPDTPLLRPAYKRRIAALPNTVGCFTLYLAFRPKSLPFSTPTNMSTTPLRGTAKTIRQTIGHVAFSICTNASNRISNGQQRRRLSPMCVTKRCNLGKIRSWDIAVLPTKCGKQREPNSYLLP